MTLTDETGIFRHTNFVLYLLHINVAQPGLNQ